MDSLADSAAIIQYHRDMISWHGEKSTYALGWKDKESQLVRFKTLSGIADLHNLSVLDAGCGYGDLLPYLTNLYGRIDYTGIELLPELIAAAITNYGKLPGAAFIQGNFTVAHLPLTDYVFSSGSLNYRSTSPGYIFKTIQRLYQACRHGLAFNLLREIAPNGLLIAYDPSLIMNFCRSICSNVKLTDDYAAEDFTIYMYRKS